MTDVFDAIHALLGPDAQLKELLPGGILTGKMVRSGEEPEELETQPDQDYGVITPLPAPTTRTSSSVHEAQGVQLSVFTYDRGTGVDAYAQMRAALNRATALLEDGDDLLAFTAGEVVGVLTGTLHYVQEGDLGWHGQRDFTIQTQRPRALP